MKAYMMFTKAFLDYGLVEKLNGFDFYEVTFLFKARFISIEMRQILKKSPKYIAFLVLRIKYVVIQAFSMVEYQQRSLIKIQVC